MPNPNKLIDFFDSWKRNLIPLVAIPLILVGCIYISYGELFDSIIANQNLSPTRLLELKTQQNIFKIGFTPTQPLKSLPEVVRIIGYNSINAIYFLFIIWIVIFLISNYKKLLHRQGSKLLMLLEIILILVIFVFSISPGMGLLFSLIGYFIISIFLMILLLYWRVGNMNKK